MGKLLKWFSSLGITTKYIITIILIIVPFAIGGLYTQSKNDDMDHYGIGYNMVQNERLRTFVIADLVQRVVDGNAEGDSFKEANSILMLQTELPIFEDTIDSLRYGDEELGLLEVEDQDIIDRLDVLIVLVDQYVESSEKVMADPTDVVSREETIDLTYQIDNELFHLAVLYESNYHTGYESLSFINFFVAMITVMFLIFSLFLVRILRKNEFYAKYDTLTKVRNRNLIFEDIEQLNADDYHVIYIDLKEFKLINDVYGNETGDDILVLFANRLRQFCNTNSIYRFAGDEFVILKKNDSTMDILYDIANFREKLAEPFIDNRNRNHFINISMGVVTSGVGITDFEDKISLAIDLRYDSGNYKLKTMICDTFEKAEVRINLKKRIYNAIENSEISPYFQPLVWADGRIKGFESLARWNLHGEIINPGAFIPLVNRNGMGFELDMKMIEEVGKVANKLIDASPNKDIHISINLAVDTLNNVNVSELIEKMDSAGVSSNHIIFEVLEDVIIGEKTRSRLKKLKEAGFKIALDDFTTGATSFEYLKHEEIDFVKIDKQVLKGLEAGHTNSIVLSDLVKMIHNAGKLVIIEGVESKEELYILREIGVDIIQGYYYSKPMKLKDAIIYLEKEKKA